MHKVYYTMTAYGPWTIHDLFNELCIYYHVNYNAQIFTKVGGHIYIPEFDYNVGDCEIFIYDNDKDILKIISFSETATDTIKILSSRNKKEDILIILHELSWLNSIPLNHNFSIHYTTFYPFSPKVNYAYYYNLRQLKKYNKQLIDKIFFRTTTGRGDEKKLSELGIINDLFPPIVAFDEYLNLAINYKIGLSISGGSYEICHRDFDCMSIGLPLLRLELIGNYSPRLIANYHYISVDRKKNNLPYDTCMDLKGGNDYIEAYKNRFLEIKDDEEFLNFVSKNAYEYCNKYLFSSNRLNRIINLLNNEVCNE